MSNRNEDFVAGAIVGGIIVFFLTIISNHLEESRCQKVNNVADCKWIYIPVEPKGTNQ